MNKPVTYVLKNGRWQGKDILQIQWQNYSSNYCKANPLTLHYEMVRPNPKMFTACHAENILGFFKGKFQKKGQNYFLL